MHFYMHYVFAKDKNIFLWKSETSILVECNIFKFVRGLKNTYRIMFVNLPFTNEFFGSGLVEVYVVVLEKMNK